MAEQTQMADAHAVEATAHGKLEIHLLEGKFKYDHDTIGKMDPYIVMKHRDQEWHGAPCMEGGKTPVWKDQHHTFDVKYLGDDFKFRIMDKDTVSDDFVGEGTIKGTAMAIGGGVCEWFSTHEHGKVTGEIKLKTVFHKA